MKVSGTVEYTFYDGRFKVGCVWYTPNETREDAIKQIRRRHANAQIKERETN